MAKIRDWFNKHHLICIIVFSFIIPICGIFSFVMVMLHHGNFIIPATILLIFMLVFHRIESKFEKDNETAELRAQEYLDGQLEG